MTATVRRIKKIDFDVDAVVERLRAARREEEDSQYQQGYEQGHEWAQNTASPSELEALSNLEPDVVSVSLEEYSLGPVWRDGRMYEAAALCPEDPFDRGIIDGARKVWHTVLPRL